MSDPTPMSDEEQAKLLEDTDNSLRPEDGDQSLADNTPGEAARQGEQ